jgi:hypothetical protein
MAKASPFLADIDNAITQQCARPTWFDLLAADAQSELLAVRKRWHAGGYTVKRLTLARLIIKVATDRGWKVCDYKRMGEWLAKND